jgi:hypothetical protein
MSLLTSAALLHHRASSTKQAARHPSPATVMRMLHEHDQKTAAAGVNLIWIWPVFRALARIL